MSTPPFARPDGPLVTLPPLLETPEALDERRLVRLDGAFNFRDLGGYRTADGSTVKWGKVFRSDHLADLTDADRTKIAALGLRTVIDFRLAFEREQRPTRLSPGPEVLHLGMTDNAAAEDSVRQIQAAFAGDAPMPEWDYWFLAYQDMLDRSMPMFVRTMTRLADAESLPALFHCTGGKDRTGMASVLLLGMLGVDGTAVLDDFELTNLHRTPVRVREMEPVLAAKGIDIDAALPLLGVVREAMAAAHRRIVERHGGAAAYLVEHGLDPAVPDRLRELLLESA